jgi:DNA-binding transcriptional LysR family regulator
VSVASDLDRLAAVDLNLLPPLLALLEERSVTRAAARVGLSQPAMSHALARIRRLVDDDLLVRQGRSMVLTPHASELLGPLREVLGQVALVVRFPEFDSAVDARTITITCSTSTAYVLGGHLARLVAERAPHATLRLKTLAEIDDSVFTDPGTDVVLLSEAIPAPYPRERLYDDRWVVIAAVDAAPAGATALDLLTDLPHAVFGAGARRVTPYAILDEHDVDYTVRQVVPDKMLLPALVARTGGVAVHRLRVVSTDLFVDRLRIEEFPFPVDALGIDLVWNPRLTDQALISWLRRVLGDAAAGLSG